MQTITFSGIALVRADMRVCQRDARVSYLEVGVEHAREQMRVELHINDFAWAEKWSVKKV